MRRAVLLIAFVALVVVCFNAACTSSSKPHGEQTAIAVAATDLGAVFGHAPPTDAETATKLTLSKNGLALREVTTDADGNYRIDRVDAGQYTLEMETDGRATDKSCDPTKRACLIPPARIERRVFDLAPGEQHREDFSL